MGSFSFNETAGTSQNTTKPRLKGNDIYEVVFDGCELQDIVGVKDPTITYKVLKLKFSNEEGSFEHTVFEPKADDFNRKKNDYVDKKTGVTKSLESASGVETMMLVFKHAIDSINPVVAKEIDDNKKTLSAKDWDGLRKLVSLILDKGKGATTKIKLIKNGKGEAIFPGYPTGITKEGKVYIKNNFIGSKVAFTPAEIDKMNKEQSATPTKMEGMGSDVKFTDNSDLNIDFDVTDL